MDGRRSFGGGAGYIPYQGYGLGLGYGPSYGFDDAFDGFYATDSPAPYGTGPGNYDPAYGGGDPGMAYPPTPTIIVNQNFQTDSVHPQLRDYSNTPLPEPGSVMVPPSAPVPPAPPLAPVAQRLADDQPTIFLIAMQDHTIHPVIAYWVQGDTLNYITVEGAPNHVSLALVDRNFSKQLNAERNVPFALPAAR
jgi:hypothetical protein